jgi:membrane protease YdiL (CAAX protease family)
MRTNFQIKGNPLAALLALVVFILLGSLIAGLLFAAIGFIIPPFKEILYSGAPQTGDFLRAMLFVNFPIMFLFPTIYVAIIYTNGEIKKFVQLNKIPLSRYFWLAPLAIILCQPALNLIGDWNKQLALPDAFLFVEQWMKASEAKAEVISKLIVDTNSLWVLGINVIVVAILPGFCEELLFRGVVQPIFVDWFGKKHVAVWASAFIFSFIHFQFYGFLPRLLLGAMLGYLVLYSGSLWSCIIAHTFNNTLVVILSYLQYNHLVNIEIDSVGFGKTTGIGVLSILITILLFRFLVYNKLEKESGDLQSTVE